MFLGRLFRNPKTWMVISAVAGVGAVYAGGQVNTAQAVQLLIAAIFGGSVTRTFANPKS